MIDANERERRVLLGAEKVVWRKGGRRVIQRVVYPETGNIVENLLLFSAKNTKTILAGSNRSINEKDSVRFGTRGG